MVVKDYVDLCFETQVTQLFWEGLDAMDYTHLQMVIFSALNLHLVR